MNTLEATPTASLTYRGPITATDFEQAYYLASDSSLAKRSLYYIGATCICAASILSTSDMPLSTALPRVAPLLMVFIVGIFTFCQLTPADWRWRSHPLFLNVNRTSWRRFTTDAIVCCVDGQETNVPWSALQTWKARDQVAVLMFSDPPNAYLVAAAEGFHSATEWTLFPELLTRKLGPPSHS